MPALPLATTIQQLFFFKFSFVYSWIELEEWPSWNGHRASFSKVEMSGTSQKLTTITVVIISLTRVHNQYGFYKKICLHKLKKKHTPTDNTILGVNCWTEKTASSFRTRSPTVLTLFRKFCKLEKEISCLKSNPSKMRKHSKEWPSWYGTCILLSQNCPSLLSPWIATWVTFLLDITSSLIYLIKFAKSRFLLIKKSQSNNFLSHNKYSTLPR